jgi:hypothetical protein
MRQSEYYPSPNLDQETTYTQLLNTMHELSTVHEPLIEHAEMKHDCVGQITKCIEVTARNPEVDSHHTITNDVTIPKDYCEMVGITIITRDLVQMRDGPSLLTNKFYEVHGR